MIPATGSTTAIRKQVRDETFLTRHPAIGESGFDVHRSARSSRQVPGSTLCVDVLLRLALRPAKGDGVPAMCN